MIKFDHLPHRLHHGLLFLTVSTGVPLVKFSGYNLPPHTVLIDEPPTLYRLPASARESVPVGVDLFLVFTWNDNRNRLVELHFAKSI